ncbi:AraC family transcriptional regulator [Ketobacter sp.]|uniref:AraC family transcriptional regulator n=1 Tax=Ketobacter sp. TaxID=2083498 RepID=UPI000F1CAAFA|nr:AraC family transcriptional regulator [Ketobacter sp.]RLT95968.1 MAG: AraC family transcriptional regulator [Ketobacter sp.]
MQKIEEKISKNNTKGNGESRQEANKQLLDAISKRLLKIALTDGDYATDIPALSVHRRNHITDDIPCIYDLGLAVTIAGQKQVTAGQDVYNYGGGEALLASVDMPVVSRVMQASPTEPYLGIMLQLNPQLVMQVASGITPARATRDTQYRALSKSTLDAAMLNALDRLLGLLDEPALLATVTPLVIQEIIARLLVSPHGLHFLQLNAMGTPSRQIANCIAWLKQHYMESISIESLADQAHMSPTTFRQHFKTIAGISPLQYIKHLRLQEARLLMLNEGLDASTSGLQVGYESVSQFNREYARLFGEPPLRDIKKLREAARY